MKQKVDFTLTASPHGDSIDSSTRPGAPTISDPSTAGNLLLFDGENDLAKGEKLSLHSYKRNNTTMYFLFPSQSLLV